MRLGTSSPLKHTSPEDWAKNQIRLGCTTFVFPVQSNEPEDKIIAYKEAADKVGLSIADVYKALALGANAAAVGRSMLPALENEGAEGVKKFLTGVGNELRFIMSCTGFPKVSDIDSSALELATAK